MIDGSVNGRLANNPSLKAGACGIELMPPPLGGGREQTGQES